MQNSKYSRLIEEYSGMNTDEIIETKGDLDGFISEKYDHYLIKGTAMDWQGRDGYKIVDCIEDIFYSQSERTIMMTESRRKGKVLLFMVSSHDCPTGSSHCAIGLTQREYNKVYDYIYCGKFNEINEFIEEATFAVYTK